VSRKACEHPSNAILLGNTLVDYDKAGRFTWKFLRDSTAEQIRAVTNYAVAADNKLVNGLIVNRLFNPAAQENEFGHTCYPLWSNDGMVPPPYLGKQFDSSHGNTKSPIHGFRLNGHWVTV
jgi:hypothetical protein